LKLSPSTPKLNPSTYTCVTNLSIVRQKWKAVLYHKLCTYISSPTAHHNLVKKNPSCLIKHTIPHHLLTPKQKPCITIKILHLRAVYIYYSVALTTHHTPQPAAITPSHASIYGKKSKHLLKRIQYISIPLPSNIPHSSNQYVSHLYKLSFHNDDLFVSHTNTNSCYFLTDLSHTHHIPHMAHTKIVARLSDQPSMSQRSSEKSSQANSSGSRKKQLLVRMSNSTCLSSHAPS
jgi:hypothetical protein